MFKFEYAPLHTNLHLSEMMLAVKMSIVSYPQILTTNQNKIHMKKLKRLFINKHASRISYYTAAGAGFIAAGSQAHAQVIISDNFSSASGNYGSTLNGAAVSTGGTNVNLTGNKYINAGSFNNGDREYKRTGQYSGNSPGLSSAGTNYAGFGGGSAPTGTGAAAIVLGAYNTGSLAVSADILGYAQGYNTGTPGAAGSQPVLANSWALAGFTSRTTASSNYSSTNPLTLFTGLQASGTGALQEYVHGTAVGSAIAYGGTYSSTTPAVLTYDLNTATGAISDVSFGSSTATYNFSLSGSWSSTDTASALIGGWAGTGNAQAQFANWSISEVQPVPEPSTYALLVSGAAVLGTLQLRRRNRVA
jgi:hypothetical protein